MLLRFVMKAGIVNSKAKVLAMFTIASMSIRNFSTIDDATLGAESCQSFL